MRSPCHITRIIHAGRCLSATTGLKLRKTISYVDFTLRDTSIALDYPTVASITLKFGFPGHVIHWLYGFTDSLNILRFSSSVG